MIDEELEEIKYGLEDGFNICCILWYITSWVDINQYFNMEFPYLDSNNVYFSSHYKISGINHILCPEHMIKSLENKI